MDRPKKQRRYCVLAPGCFAQRAAKTAHGVIAYGREPVVAVIDPALQGKTVRDAVPYLQSDAPIVESLDAALDYKPNAMLLGVASPGGELPDEWRPHVLAALRAGLEIVSGLHTMLGDDPEFAEAAYYGGTSIWDVRSVPATPVFSGAAFDVKPFVLLTVGSDAAVGKMTVSLELVKAACERKRNPEFIATGQTGIMIAGKGIAVDRVISDFAAGAVETLVTGHDPDSDLLIVEGQGGINHAAFAPVTLALLFGAAPDALILVHNVSRKEIDRLHTPVLPPSMLVRLYETLAGTVKPAPVLGLALNTAALEDDAARSVIAEYRRELGLPVDDLVRYGPQNFYDAIAAGLSTKTRPLSAAALP